MAPSPPPTPVVFVGTLQTALALFLFLELASVNQLRGWQDRGMNRGRRGDPNLYHGAGPVGVASRLVHELPAEDGGVVPVRHAGEGVHPRQHRLHGTCQRINTGAVGLVCTCRFGTSIGEENEEGMLYLDVVLVVPLDDGGVEEVGGGGAPRPLHVLPLAAEVGEVVGEAEQEVDAAPRRPRSPGPGTRPRRRRPALNWKVIYGLNSTISLLSDCRPRKIFEIRP
jgi:hypothetical protein